jgi:hypothetical protein
MNVSDTLARQLLPGERVLWTGRPSPGLVLRPVDAFLIPFSLLWGGFALFWNIGVWTTGAPHIFKLWGLPFLVAGLYVTVGRFFVDTKLRQRLTYAVTDRRVLIVKDRASLTTTSLDLRRLPALELAERPNGFGTIRFGSSGGWSGGRNFGIWQPALDPTPQFIRIPNARAVYRLIQQHSAS